MIVSASYANMGSSEKLAERVLAHSPAVAQRRYPLNTEDLNELPGYCFGDPRLPERFWRHVRLTDTCWVWTGRKIRGYGRFKSGDQASYQAHRVTYGTLVGFLEAYLEIDHLCRNKACVNPAHLEPVTKRENQLRGIGFVARNAAKTHCAHGHPFDEANTYIRTNGRRDCRACAAQRARDYQRRKRAA